MPFRRVNSLLMACCGAGALLTAIVAANAGGFAVREQSAYGQGSSFAGVAAGGSLSSMFWNPSTMTQMPGLQSESTVSGILPYSANNATGGPLLAFGGTGNTANAAVVPGSYYSYQFNPNLWIGLSVTAPFGLSVTMPDLWAGRDFGAGGTNMQTYNFTPSIAYKLSNWISIGAGVQVQYASAAFTKGLAAAPTQQAGISGAGYGYGFTAGVTLTPTPSTTVGLGWRSAINQKINGTLVLPSPAINPAFGAPFSTPGSVNTTINLPDVVSLGLRQRVSPNWTVLATVEWSNWSRIGTSAAILQPSGAPALVATIPSTIPFQYKDGWFYSLGAEYQWNPQLALRAGVAYETSPITDQVRIPPLPDNDRTWLSAGASYQYSAKMSFDFAYSHIFVKSAPINIVDTTNPAFVPGLTAPYTGSVSSHIDIISVAMKYRWDDPAPTPIKQAYYK